MHARGIPRPHTPHTGSIPCYPMRLGVKVPTFTCCMNVPATPSMAHYPLEYLSRGESVISKTIRCEVARLNDGERPLWRRRLEGRSGREYALRLDAVCCRSQVADRNTCQSSPSGSFPKRSAHHLCPLLSPIHLNWKLSLTKRYPQYEAAWWQFLAIRSASEKPSTLD